jgi:hypothetical protein
MIYDCGINHKVIKIFMKILIKNRKNTIYLINATGH